MTERRQLMLVAAHASARQSPGKHVLYLGPIFCTNMTSARIKSTALLPRAPNRAERSRYTATSGFTRAFAPSHSRAASSSTRCPKTRPRNDRSASFMGFRRGGRSVPRSKTRHVEAWILARSRPRRRAWGVQRHIWATGRHLEAAATTRLLLNTSAACHQETIRTARPASPRGLAAGSLRAHSGCKTASCRSFEGLDVLIRKRRRGVVFIYAFGDGI